LGEEDFVEQVKSRIRGVAGEGFRANLQDLTVSPGGEVLSSRDNCRKELFDRKLVLRYGSATLDSGKSNLE